MHNPCSPHEASTSERNAGSRISLRSTPSLPSPARGGGIGRGRATIAALALALGAVDAGQAESAKIPKSPLDRIKERSALDPPRRKIILGSPASAGAYPFVVSLISATAKPGREFEAHFCGATFIAPTWVLTAAHCVTENGEVAASASIQIYAGSQNFRGGERIAIKSIRRHPSFAEDYTENDIALLQLARPPAPATRYKPIELIDPATESRQTAAGTAVTVLGWGATEQNELSQVLLRATVRMVDREQCNRDMLRNRINALQEELGNIQRHFRIASERLSKVRDAIVDIILGNAGTVVTESMLCAGDPDAKSSAELATDACQGDSGGPLIARGPDGAAVQVGIISWGDGCGIPAVHGVYTRLARFVDWVRATARD